MSEFSLSDVVSSLDQKESTVRRWTTKLEQSGYQFQRNNRTLVYTDVDVALFKRVKELINGLTTDAAIAVVMEKHPPEFAKVDVAVDIPEVNASSEIAEMDEYIQKFNTEYFWAPEQALRTLQQRWENFKGKISSEGIHKLDETRPQGIGDLHDD